mmetsp:Transcript_21639/g.33103  ORF Transcript_21639/g.33103 Transcript_21639/m.33103 type:complete len:105 (-) Transcript_21639:437-751(-)
MRRGEVIIIGGSVGFIIDVNGLDHTHTTTLNLPCINHLRGPILPWVGNESPRNAEKPAEISKLIRQGIPIPWYQWMRLQVNSLLVFMFINELAAAEQFVFDDEQ